MAEKQNASPKISIIIPVYKVEPYLRQCVDSVLSQTYTNFEIILVDDGSPDNCPVICDEYAAKDSRVKVIHKENGGLSDARNAGIKVAKGEYLFFLDSDDFFHKIDILENLQKTIFNNKDRFDVLINLCVTCLNGKEIIENCSYSFDCSINLLEPIFIMKKILKLKGIFLGAQVFIVKRDFLINNELLFYPNIYYEDLLWLSYVFIRAKYVYLNNEEIFCYRCGRADSIMGSVNLRKIESLLTIIGLLSIEAEKLKNEYKSIINLWIRCIYRQSLKKSSQIKLSSDLFQKIKIQSRILKSGSFLDKTLYLVIKLFGIHFILHIVRIVEHIKNYRGGN